MLCPPKAPAALGHLIDEMFATNFSSQQQHNREADLSNRWIRVQCPGGGRLSEAASRARALVMLATATMIATATLRTPIPGRAVIELVANRPLS